jgi:hypothetical protein
MESENKTYDKAMASEAQTGLRRMCLMGYRTPAAIGTAAMLYISAHNWCMSRVSIHLRPSRVSLTKLSFTRKNTVADRSTKVKMLLRFDETRMNEALESATSLPDPIAIATSAAASAYRTVNYVEKTTENIRTHRRIVYAIPNYGHYTAAIQSSPRQNAKI